MLGHGASRVAQTVKNLPAVQETGFSPWVRKIPWRREWLPTPGQWGVLLDRAWTVPWTEPAGLESVELQRVGHD